MSFPFAIPVSAFSVASMKAVLAFLFSALFLVSSAHGGGKSATAYIGIHVEGDQTDGPKMVRPCVINGKEHFFRISPEVVTRHFEAFHAFVAEDGATYGAALRLNGEGLRAMQIMLSLNQSRLARTIVNGRALDILRLDKGRDDGYFIIWGGLGPEDLKLFSKKLKRLDSGVPGEDVKPEKKKKKSS